MSHDDPLTPDEILAYRDGTLSPQERLLFEARLAADPDTARALADLPNVEPAPGSPEPPSDEEILDSVRALVARVRAAHPNF
jgi:anti-sigma factor RsiW